MKCDQHLVTKGWAEYELLDSGENMKLERYGEIIVARPETQALWKKSRPELWKQANAVFEFKGGSGSWEITKVKPLESASRFNLATDSWQISRGPIKFLAKLTNFKHVGVFPEQEPNWSWIAEQVRIVSRQVPARKQSGLPGEARTGDPRTFSQQAPGANVLNLFGYTGIATLAAVQAGACVTHVDSSKQSLDWAHENARLSGIPEDRIRWILEDALAFTKREVRRGIKYDGIILDPPAFGRGAKNEVWKIEEDLPKLLESLKELLSDKPGSFFLLNGYAAGYAPLSFAQAVESVFAVPDVALAESGELRIQESNGNRQIPAGIYVRFVR